jgi:hypothetical protein
MKKTINKVLKLILVFLIFSGLQGRVVIRYLEVFHIKHAANITKSKHPVVKEAIVHCKLQCYTRHFQILDLPLAAFLLVILSVLVERTIFYINYNQAVYITNWHIRRSPRGPPVLS